MKNIIIFDFDGVLADSLDTAYAMNKETLAHIGKTLTKKEYTDCFQGHINQGLTKLFNLTDEEREKMVEVKAGLFSKYSTPENITLFSFAKDLVTEVVKLGELWIVSSTPSEFISAILKSQDLEKYFTHIYGQNKQAKSIIFEQVLKEHKDSNVFFITDTTGDLKETKKMDRHFYTIAVPWGFHDRELLKTEHPHLLAEKPEEIVNFIKAH